MIGHALVTLAGNLLVLLWPRVLPAACVPVAAVLLAVAVAAGRLRPALLLAATLWTAHAVDDQRARTVRLDERVLAEVTLTSLPAFAGTARQFDGLARLTRLPGAPTLRIRATWRRGVSPALRAGETWQMALQLRAMHASVNPGAVDGLRVLWRDHIHARAEVLDSPLNRRLSPGKSLLLRLREDIARRLLDAVADPAAAALLAALAVGYTAEVDRAEWQIYNATGITHLIAISGMHVTLFAAVAMTLLRHCWAAWPWLAWRVRRESFVALAGAACALAYALLAGYSVPTQRTALMLVAGLTWRAFARSSTAASALGAATIAVLVTDPFATLAAGFWLSFGAVAAILWREAARLRPPPGVRGALRLQIALTAVLAPATLANFSSVSLVGLFVNPLAIPLFSFVLVPLVLLVAALQLLGLPTLGAIPLWLADQAATPTVAWLARAAHVPIGLWQSDPPWWWYAFALAACLVLLLPFSKSLRLLAVAAVLPLLCAPSRPATGGFRALALDAGGPPLVLIVTRSHALLYGTGDRFGTAGSRIVNLALPAARRLGVARLDLLLAPRLDRDVSRSVGAVQALLPAQRIAAGMSREGALPAGIEDCASLAPWQWDGVRFAVTGGSRGGGCALTVTTSSASLSLGDVPPERSGAAEVLEAAPGAPLRRAWLRPGLGAWHATR